MLLLILRFLFVICFLTLNKSFIERDFANCLCSSKKAFFKKELTHESHLQYLRNRTLSSPIWVQTVLSPEANVSVSAVRHSSISRNTTPPVHIP